MLLGDQRHMAVRKILYQRVTSAFYIRPELMSKAASFARDRNVVSDELSIPGIAQILSDNSKCACPAEFQKFSAEVPDLHWQALLRHNRPMKPIIAAVEGFAVAGGTEILQGTDIRVAAQDASFGVTEAKRGLFPLGGSSVRLRRQIPYTLAAEILLTARHITAQEALDFGLIGRVVPHGEALAEARKIASQICDNAPLAIRALMQMLREVDESVSEADALARELEVGGPIYGTRDAREGPRAFAEKRKAVFTGE